MSASEARTRARVVASGGDRSGRGGRLFTPRAARAGLWWVAATVPIAAGIGLFLHGEQAYLLGFVLVGALAIGPAVGLSILATRRAAPADQRFWRLVTAGIISMMVIGLLVAIEALTRSAWVVVPAAPLAIGCVVVFFAALFDLVRSRSTIRVNALDILEAAMLVIAVCAFGPVAWGDRPIVLSSAWFTIDSALTAIAVLAGFGWSIAMFRRVKGQRLPEEALGLGIGFLCSINAIAQTAEGLTGFALPASPLLVSQALCFGVVLLLPLHLDDKAPLAYDTLAPIEQTRTRSLDTIAIALLLPLLVATILRQAETPWAVWYFVGVAMVLLVLAMGRGKLAMRETRELYRSVEDAAESRKALLADVLHNVDNDRHRVAAHLHQQATGFYVAFTSFLRTSDRATGHAATAATAAMRRDLERQADHLRELMLAVRPLGTDHAGTSDLTTTIAAYIDNLYGDNNPPQVDIRIDQALELDWTTETIVLRILQEALRNVASHAHTSHLVVTLGEHEEAVALRVADDGVGFDPRSLFFESGNEQMRMFASHVGGAVTIDSRPGEGTTVRATLGGAPVHPAPGPPPAEPNRRSHLRAVADVR